MRGHMKPGDQDLIVGRLQILERLRQSRSGNPRYLLQITDREGDAITCRTAPDSALAYDVPNKDGKLVAAVLGWHYGKVTLHRFEPNCSFCGNPLQDTGYCTSCEIARAQAVD